MKFSVLVTIFLSLVPTCLLASSQDAWQEFREDVENRCQSYAEQYLTDVRVNVDLYGSQQHGIAVIFGDEKASSEPMVYACLYDKKTKKTELYVGAKAKQITQKNMPSKVLSTTSDDPFVRSEPKYRGEDVRNWDWYQKAGGDELRQAYVHWLFGPSNAEKLVQTISTLVRIGPNTTPETILVYVDSVMLDVVRSRELLTLLTGNSKRTSPEHGDLEILWLLNRARNKYQPLSIEYANLELEGFEKLSPQKSAFHTIGLDAEDVEKWVHKGGQEYVFVVGNNGQMEIVFDGLNNGTYNYCSSWACHMVMDILPWVKWGASVDDKSTPEDRARLFQKSFLLSSKIQDMSR